MDNARISNLTDSQITHYLHYISYVIGEKEKRGYKRFLKEAKGKGLIPSMSEIRYR